MLHKKGVSLADIIVFVFVWGMLSGFLGLNFNSKIDNSRDSKRMYAIADIKGSIERYLSNPWNQNMAKKIYIHKFSLSNVVKDSLGVHHVLTVDVDPKFLEVFDGLDLLKAPKDPLSKNYYRFWMAYTKNTYNAFNVAATLEHKNNKYLPNSYVEGNYIEGLFDGRKSLVAAYQDSYPATITSTGDYVYNGSTAPLLPYKLND